MEASLQVRTSEPKKMVPLETLEQVNQRTWWRYYKDLYASKIIFFHGAQIDTALTWVGTRLFSPNSCEASDACEHHVGGCCKSENSRTKKDGAFRKFGACEPKKMVTLESLGPIEIIIFNGAQTDTALTRVKKKDIETTVLWGIFVFGQHVSFRWKS
jgi:hypothetical protein